ncbi:FliM/FliN family flagellar motor switch protein [Sphingomonas sp. CFBP 13720]|uniref:FliM/FliN family flagellar motor switch protein n=1 Tax=Sphingomonas sp. CFBP 13720 TaxID=2775302 RepID=UPI00177C2D9D|nr:FliM/FliN family flagellar motor C-terminal domain-containing protein [Sphingomonas sp. CFBP 13720]MBD8679356.1 FliM/FliN family flagellar motor switch protein [Sphingomonas sp. CFBP 13720]
MNDGSPSVPCVSPTLIDSVAVELDAMLGKARMTVGALTALKPGAVVPLDAALNRQVELRLGEVTVARGELVAVDDRFGVRLTEIAQWPE